MRNDKSIFRNHFLLRTASICAVWAMLAVPALGQDQDEGEGVGMTDYDTFNIQVQDTDLGQVLQMLSLESKQNIVASMNVSGTVTANLYDVTLEEALTAILTPNGYGFITEGKFLYVFTKEEITQIEEERRKTENRVFDLNYLDPISASDAVSVALSESGLSKYLGEVTPNIDPNTDDVGADSWAYVGKLIINDFPENLDQVARLLDELDVPQAQVLVEATVLNALLDEDNALGVSFSVLGSVDFTDLASPLSGVTSLISGGFQPADNDASMAVSNVGAVSSPGGLKLGLIRDPIAAFVRALDEVTTTTVLARPKVMALNRQRAEILIGARVGYLSSTATETSTTQTVEFLDTGIHLVFMPFINGDGTIRLALAPSISEASLRTVTDSGGQTVTIPDELTNEITTNVRVQDGETLVLGGLFRESTKVSRKQVPLLGDIPIAGIAFRGQDDTIDRSEIIFLITPTIVPDQVAWDVGDYMMDHTERVRVGAREGLLPFSNDSITAGYNQDAMAAFNRGDMRLAEWYANTSLRLLPQQPEMREFRDQLRGTTDGMHERSVLERAFRHSFGDDADEMFEEEAEEAAEESTEANAGQPADQHFEDVAEDAFVEADFNWLDDLNAQAADSNDEVAAINNEQSSEQDANADEQPVEAVTAVENHVNAESDSAFDVTLDLVEDDADSFQPQSADDRHEFSGTLGFEVFEDSDDQEVTVGFANDFADTTVVSAPTKATLQELDPSFSEFGMTFGNQDQLSFAINQMINYFNTNSVDNSEAFFSDDIEIVEAPEFIED